MPERGRGGSAGLILASTSPRRSELMSRAGYEFEVVAPEADEDLAGAEGTAEEIALRLAELKARSVAGAMTSGIVIGADTIVVLDGEIIGKPDGRDDARSILGRLSDSTHQVVTGLAVIDASSGAIFERVVSTEIVMDAMSDDDIDGYVNSGESDGKAGAYAIQETGDRFVREVRGSFSNVVGLPMEALAETLDEIERISDGRD